MSGSASSVDDPFGDPFMVEVHDLLTQMEVVDQRRPSLAHPETVIRVINREIRSSREGFAGLRPGRGYASLAARQPPSPPPPDS